MNEGKQHRSGDPPAPSDSSISLRARQELRVRLREALGERFERVSGWRVALWLVDGTWRESVKNEIPLNPQETPPHPLCEGCSDIRNCVTKWLAGLVEAGCRPEPRPHDCPLGHHCSVLPVVSGHNVVAACKLVCPGDISEEAFEHNLELLDVLIETFQTLHADLLAVVAEIAAGDVRSVSPALSYAAGLRPGVGHPQVHNAIAYIEAHLADSKMTVAGIAADLKINSTYLSHLFAEQVGTRMGRYIAQRRIELAKHFLATTSWQIKRVAYESGHKNADWFSQVFHAHVGVTPCEYRRSAKLQALRPPPSEGGRIGGNS